MIPFVQIAELEPVFDSAAVRLFLCYLSSIGQIHIAVIPQYGGGCTAHDFGTDVDPALDWITKCNAQGYNVYWTVNLVRSGFHSKPGKANIIAARFLHLDVDPPKAGGTFNKAEVLQRLRECEFGPPSFVIDSGNGLQAFWQLGHGCDLVDVERANKALRQMYGGDGCRSVDHLMRVPGTVNLPNEAKQERGCVPVVSQIIYGSDNLVV